MAVIEIYKNFNIIIFEWDRILTVIFLNVMPSLRVFSEYLRTCLHHSIYQVFESEIYVCFLEMNNGLKGSRNDLICKVRHILYEGKLL